MGLCFGLFVLKKAFTKQQNDLIKHGKTYTIAGFVSKAGVAFSAKLVLNKITKEVALEFDNDHKYSTESAMTKHKCVKEGSVVVYMKKMG